MMMGNPQGQMAPPQRPPMQQGMVPPQMQMPPQGMQQGAPPQGGMDEARKRQMLVQMLMNHPTQQNAMGGIQQGLQNGLAMYQMRGQ